MGEGGAGVIIFKELAEVFLKKCLDNNASGRALIEMGFALGMHFTRAARVDCDGSILQYVLPIGKSWKMNLVANFLPGYVNFRRAP
jgi:hypothetical protein